MGIVGDWKTCYSAPDDENRKLQECFAGAVEAYVNTGDSQLQKQIDEIKQLIGNLDSAIQVTQTNVASAIQQSQDSINNALQTNQANLDVALQGTQTNVQTISDSIIQLQAQVLTLQEVVNRINGVLSIQ